MKHWLQLVAIPNAPESFNKQEVTDLKKKNVSRHLKIDEHAHVLLAGSHRKRLQARHSSPFRLQLHRPHQHHLRRKVEEKATTRAEKERARRLLKARARAAANQRSWLIFRRVRRRTKRGFIRSFTTNNCASIFRRGYAGTLLETASGSTPARGAVAAGRTTSAFVWQIVLSTTERQLLCQLIPRTGRRLSIWAWRLLLL